MNQKRLFAILIVIAVILIIDVEVLQKDYPATISGLITHISPPPVATSTTNIDNQTSTGKQHTPSSTEQSKTGVKGQVTLGPTCPVERIPPDPKCAPKPFGTSIGIYTHNVLVSFVKTDDSGKYVIDLPPGTYTFDPAGGNPYPSCKSETVTVSSAGYATLNLSCDTGIR